MRNLPDINNIITYNYNFAYQPSSPPYKDTGLEICVIRHNQFLEGQDKFPDFEINEFVFDPYSHSHHILKAGEVVLCSPLNVHVYETSVEYEIGTESEQFKLKTVESME